MTDPNYVLINGVIANNAALHQVAAAKTEGISIANQRRSEAGAEAVRQKNIASRAEWSSRDLSYKLNAAYARGSDEAKRADAQTARADALEQAVAQRDAIILEWMQSNEAFKRLARQYGKELGVTDEKQKNDVFEHVLDIAEEDPEKFANTKGTNRAKQHFGRS